MPIETGLFEVLHGLVGKSGFFDFLFIFFARWVPYGMVIAAAVFFLTRKHTISRVWGLCVAGLTVILSRGILVELISALYVRARPNVSLNFEALIPAITSAFPSGHASALFALSAAVYFLDKQWGRWFWIFAGVNAITRIIVGVHWPTDVLGGLVVALISFYAIKKLLAPYEPKQKPDSIITESMPTPAGEKE